MCHVSRICKRVPPSMPQDTVIWRNLFWHEHPLQLFSLHSCDLFASDPKYHDDTLLLETFDEIFQTAERNDSTSTMTLVCQNSVIHTQYMRLC
jgi:hypothetical protein